MLLFVLKKKNFDSKIHQSDWFERVDFLDLFFLIEIDREGKMFGQWFMTSKKLLIEQLRTEWIIIGLSFVLFHQQWFDRSNDRRSSPICNDRVWLIWTLESFVFMIRSANHFCFAAYWWLRWWWWLRWPHDPGSENRGKKKWRRKKLIDFVSMWWWIQENMKKCFSSPFRFSVFLSSYEI